MNSSYPASARNVGLWSASLSTVFSLTYVIAQLAEWAGLLGSAGGPHSQSTTAALVVLLTPSLLLAIAFVALMAAIHHSTDASRRVWSHLALAFASIYATLISIVYYTQLAFVVPRMARGETADIALLAFQPFDSFLYAVDVYGYSLMSLSMLFAAGAFAGPGLARWIRWALVANGCLIPFLALQVYYPPLIWGGALWGIAFPVAAWLLTAHFKRLPAQ